MHFTRQTKIYDRYCNINSKVANIATIYVKESERYTSPFIILLRRNIKILTTMISVSMFYIFLRLLQKSRAISRRFRRQIIYNEGRETNYLGFIRKAWSRERQLSTLEKKDRINVRSLRTVCYAILLVRLRARCNSPLILLSLVLYFMRILS